MLNHIYFYLFQYFPETAVLVMVTTIFLRLNYDWKVLGAIVTINSLLAYLLRLYPPLNGYHSIILILLMAVSFKILCQVKLIDSFLSTIKTFVILAGMEILSGYILTRYMEIPLENINSHLLYKTGIVTFNIIILFAIGLCVHYIRKHRAKKYQQKERFQSYVQKNY